MSNSGKGAGAIDGLLSRVDREVWIVTASAGEQRGGLVATFVMRTSIDRSRPSVSIGLAPNHFTTELIDRSGGFGLHLVGRRQWDVAWNFAKGSGRERDKLADLSVWTGRSGAPLLETCLGWMDCRVFARLPAGDRTYFWADVLEGAEVEEGPPLRESDLPSVATPEQLRRLREDREADVRLHQPLAERWRQTIPDFLSPGE